MADIKKIKLSNGSIYSIFDEGALRLNSQNKLITGNSIVDELIIDGDLYITEVDDVAVNNSIDNLVTAVLNTDTGAYEFKKRSTNQVLEDIGGISYSMDATGTLTFKIGK